VTRQTGAGSPLRDAAVLTCNAHSMPVLMIRAMLTHRPAGVGAVCGGAHDHGSAAAREQSCRVSIQLMLRLKQGSRPGRGARPRNMGGSGGSRAGIAAKTVKACDWYNINEKHGRQHEGSREEEPALRT